MHANPHDLRLRVGNQLPGVEEQFGTDSQVVADGILANEIGKAWTWAKKRCGLAIATLVGIAGRIAVSIGFGRALPYELFPGLHGAKLR